MRKKYRLIVLILFFTLAGCTTVYNPATGRNESYLLSEQQELSWGNSMAQQIISETKLSTNQQTVSYVETLGTKIGKLSHRSSLPFQFYVIDEDQVNAFAVPGGHIFVYQGLLDKINEEELAFVLAHEIGHVCARHSLKKLGANLGFTVLTSLIFRSPDGVGAKQLTNAFYNIISLGYSRKDEFEADKLGLQYAVKGGYNPQAAITLLELFQKESEGGAKIPSYLRTHPYPEQRITRIKEIITTGDDSPKQQQHPPQDQPEENMRIPESEPVLVR